jgi:hypothetical protein
MSCIKIKDYWLFKKYKTFLMFLLELEKHKWTFGSDLTSQKI